MSDQTGANREIEIGRAADRDSFEPTEGRLFWAADTDTMYLGDGDRWANLSDRQRQDHDKGMVAPPGSVQQRIDAAASGSAYSEGVNTVVKLQTNTEYNPSTPWSVRRGVILDFNGATVRPSDDSDVIYMYPGTELRQPRIDLRGIDFTSNAITINTAFDGAYGLVVNKATIRGGQIIASPGEGTGIRLLETTGDDIVNPQLYANVQGFDTAIELYTGSPSSFINATVFEGSLTNYRVGIRHHGRGTASGNYYHLRTQPFAGTTEMLWLLESDARYNVLEGQIWDPNVYSGPIWKISESAGGYNSLFNYLAFLEDRHIENNSERTNGLVNVWELTQAM